MPVLVHDDACVCAFFSCAWPVLVRAKVPPLVLGPVVVKPVEVSVAPQVVQLVQVLPVLVLVVLLQGPVLAAALAWGVVVVEVRLVVKPAVGLDLQRVGLLEVVVVEFSGLKRVVEWLGQLTVWLQLQVVVMLGRLV